jgi:hypothetical protein
MRWVPKPSTANDLASAASRLAAEHPSVADLFIESYVCWREACEDVRSAYEHWRDCASPQRGLAFETYRAALDREEHAARVYSDWAERLRAAERWERRPAEGPRRADREQSSRRETR